MVKRLRISRTSGVQQPPRRGARSLLLGITALLLATAGSLLWGTGTASAQNAPSTPSSCTASRTADGYKVVVQGVAAIADRIHIRNNGRNREPDGTWMGQRLSPSHGSTVTFERLDQNRTGVHHFSVRALNGTAASGYRYCNSVTFPEFLNCSVVANADGTNTVTWGEIGGIILYRNGEVIAGTVTASSPYVDSDGRLDRPVLVPDLVPGRTYHYSVDYVPDDAPKEYCGSVVAKGSSGPPGEISHCFVDFDRNGTPFIAWFYDSSNTQRADIHFWVNGTVREMGFIFGTESGVFGVPASPQGTLHFSVSPTAAGATPDPSGRVYCGSYQN